MKLRLLRSGLSEMTIHINMQGRLWRLLKAVICSTKTFGTLILFILHLVLGRETLAQGLGPTLGSDSATSVGGAGGLRRPAPVPLLSSTQNSKIKTHTSPMGKPCLSVFGQAQPQTINPNIFEHLITAQNDCSQPIKMQVCYYQSQQCLRIDVPAYGRKEAVLGIMPAMKQFQFEYREDFSNSMGPFGASHN